MADIRFSDGTKSYTVNGDPNRVIRIHATDFSILGRIRDMQAALDALQLPKDDAAEGAAVLDKEIRRQIDHVFGAGVSETAFGRVNCLSLAGGHPLFENFLGALIPAIEAEMKEELEQANAAAERYAKQAEILDAR